MTNRIEIKDLLVTQNVLRNFKQIESMIEHIVHDGLWNRKALDAFNQDSIEPLISISEFPDGKRYIRDGHHRCCATFLAERDYLLSSEYIITPRTYEQYMSVNFDVGWVTPFDPRHEVRLSDFMDFKRLAIYMRSDHTDDEVVEYIKQNKFKYLCPRTMNTVNDLISLYNYFQKTGIEDLTLKGEKMKPLTLVKFDFDGIPESYHKDYPFTPLDRFIYLGDIVQMPGHCVVTRVSDGRVFNCFHTESFIALTDDEV